MERSETEIFEQNRITELKSRLFALERDMKDERSKLWHEEKRSQEQYVVWERLEVLSTYIFGYVSQVTTKGYTIQEPEKVISHLHKLSIFNVECIMKWYATGTQEYPKIKEFFELLDYISLLTIDYIQRYRLQKELTAE